jgi:hypothetical protein
MYQSDDHRRDHRRYQRDDHRSTAALNPSRALPPRLVVALDS